MSFVAPTSLRESLPSRWEDFLQKYQQPLPSDSLLLRLAESEQVGREIYPPCGQRFAALQLCDPQQVKVVIVGQDPYHGPGQAHGLSFSVPPGVKIPPSLRNIFAELEADLGLQSPDCGDLTVWAQRGVLLLNSVLTVEKGVANSHQGWGWESFTDGILEALSADSRPKVFILWGSFAAAKRVQIDEQRHKVVTSSHPSPLSAYRGFLGSKPFSQANCALQAAGREPVDWSLPVQQSSLF